MVLVPYKIYGRYILGILRVNNMNRGNHLFKVVDVGVKLLILRKNNKYISIYLVMTIGINNIIYHILPFSDFVWLTLFSFSILSLVLSRNIVWALLDESIYSQINM